MKRHLLTFAVLLTLAIPASAQRSFNLYGVGFYNLENLFDTCHDVGKNDYEDLPDGANKWSKLKYERKLHNMAYALADMGTDKLPIGCAVIGVAVQAGKGVEGDLLPEQAQLLFRLPPLCHGAVQG